MPSNIGFDCDGCEYFEIQDSYTVNDNITATHKSSSAALIKSTELNANPPSRTEHFLIILIEIGAVFKNFFPTVSEQVVRSLHHEKLNSKYTAPLLLFSPYVILTLPPLQ